MCIKCGVFIEGYYDQRIKDINEALKDAGMNATADTFYEAKDIWYEYCDLHAEIEADEAAGDGDPSQWTY